MSARKSDCEALQLSIQISSDRVGITVEEESAVLLRHLDSFWEWVRKTCNKNFYHFIIIFTAVIVTPVGTGQTTSS
jgi:hypothetical protein